MMSAAEPELRICASPGRAQRRRAPRVSLTATLVSLLTTGVVLALGAASAAAAEPCPNEALRSGPSANLPDCRAYEQVSPTAKGFADALGAPGYVQTSPSGEAVTYFSFSPFPGITPGSAEFPTYLASRDGGEWSSQGLLPPTDPNGGSGVIALTEDLSQTIVSDSRSEPPLTEEATAGQKNFYLHDNATGEYRLLAPSPERRSLYFADSNSHASRILFETKEQLLAEAPAGKLNLYEWHDGVLSLPGRVPPPGEPSCGPSGPACELAQGSEAGAGASQGPSSRPHYTEHTISTNGSRVFFTDLVNERLFVRENGETTVAVSVGAAHFRAATPDGRFVFYTDEAGKLWRFDVAAETRLELAPGAVGLLGVSDDGSYAYFVDASYQLYEWHEGDEGQPAPTLIAALYGPGGPGVEGAEGDVDDWTDTEQTNGSGPSGGGLKSSLVSADGNTALFFHGSALLRYDATDATLAVIAGSALFGHSELAINGVSPVRNLFSTRNLSADGSRVFFQTKDALLPADTNGQMDVYEWEAPGHGSCEESSSSFSQSSGGCLYLISTGKSPNPSYFGDASASGEDVFFFTRQPLIGQDADNNVDLYDARVGGGIAAQSPPPPVPICAGEGCSPPPVPTPDRPTAGSTDPGPGNPVPPTPCKPGFVRKHNKCVKRPRKPKHRRRTGAKGRAAR